jgi:hypothetical protein
MTEYPMNIFRDRLSRITREDIEQLCADAVSEGLELELKSDLPARGDQPDGWYIGQGFGDYARNQIAEEIIAFANTMGGVVLIGVKETVDHPRRTDKPNPLPRVHDLARRLRQAVHGIIDPPLPLLEAEGIEFAAGSGIVIMRVAASRRKPHRHQVNKDVFVRRADESVRIGMREIQEMTIQSAAEATRVDEAIEKRRENFRHEFVNWNKRRDDHGTPTLGAAAVHFVGVPTTPFDLGRVAGRSDILPHIPRLTALVGGGRHNCSLRSKLPLIWRPGLRSITAENKDDIALTEYLLKTDGLCEFRLFKVNTPETPGLFFTWLVAGLAVMLNWIDIIRRGASDVGAEFALAPVIAVLTADAVLAEYGITHFVEAQGTRLPVGMHDFNIMSVGAADEFPIHIARFNEDIWNLAGEVVPEGAFTFEIASQ